MANMCFAQFDMEDSDVIQVHQEQIGGGAAGTC